MTHYSESSSRKRGSRNKIHKPCIPACAGMTDKNFMKVLILGAKGLLAGALQKVFANEEVVAYDREELDVTDFAALREAIEKIKPAVIINCVAWNDVDGAEKNPSGARLLNCEVVRELAISAKDLGITFVTYSTDVVFDGEKQSGYREDDMPNPLNEYGKSKRTGEEAVEQVGGKYYLIRTSRLYGPMPVSPGAKKSFVFIMMDLAKKNPELRVVNEEPAALTNVADLAAATQQLVEEKYPYGIYHFTNSGFGTWYDYAKEIFAILGESVKLIPVTRAEFPRPAPSPRCGILLNTKFPPLRDWRVALNEFLLEHCS